MLNLDAFEKARPHKAEILVVADGMGGVAEGDKASSIAVKVILMKSLTITSRSPSFRKTTKLFLDDDVQGSLQMSRSAQYQGQISRCLNIRGKTHPEEAWVRQYRLLSS